MRNKLASILICCGVLAILFGLGGLAGAPVASAQGFVPQPSPRPPVDLDGDSGGRSATTVADTGHVTGTVIDVVTGAPLPGIPVRVGPDLVMTDENGNYDHWLPTGSYTVQVMVDPLRGAAAQEPMQVAVEAGGRTLQHLGVRPAAEAPAAPAPAPAPARSAAPVMAAEPEIAVAAADVPPATLPRTGVDVDAGLVWIVAGVLLVGLGWALWGRPVSRLAPALGRSSRLPSDFDRRAMLADLLGAKGARRTNGDELLEELLARDDPGR
jgi:hypothetical protein